MGNGEAGKPAVWVARNPEMVSTGSWVRLWHEIWGMKGRGDDYRSRLWPQEGMFRLCLQPLGSACTRWGAALGRGRWAPVVVYRVGISTAPSLGLAVILRV